MNLHSIILKCNDLIQSHWTFSISINDFNRNGGFINYNSIIRENIPKDAHGVYVISNTLSNEILYVGMSGQIKLLDNGRYGNCGYDIRKRLVSSRKKDKNGKDINSSDYFKSKMMEKELDSITFLILQSKKIISPTYLESHIIQWIFSETGTLPIWNKSF
jgi:hypothetical protein